MSDKNEIVVLEITEEDLRDAAEIGALPSSGGVGDVVLSEDQTKEIEQKVYDLLPKAIAKKLDGFVPDNFSLNEIEMYVTIKGSPFSVGVDGRLKVKYTRKN